MIIMTGRKRVKYRFTYDGKSITKDAFLRGIGANADNWKRKCVRSRWGDFSCGLFKAHVLDD